MDLIMILKDYQTLITGIIATFVVVIGFYLTYIQLNQMKKDRHSELSMNLWSIWNSNVLIESRKCLSEIEIGKESLCEKIKEYDKSDSEKYLTLLMVCNYYEHMGWLISKEYIDMDLVIDNFRYPIIHYYEYYEEYILDRRKDGTPDLFIYFEKLKDRASETKV